MHVSHQEVDELINLALPCRYKLETLPEVERDDLSRILTRALQHSREEYFEVPTQGTLTRLRARLREVAMEPDVGIISRIAVRTLPSRVGGEPVKLLQLLLRCARLDLKRAEPGGSLTQILDDLYALRGIGDWSVYHGPNEQQRLDLRGLHLEYNGRGSCMELGRALIKVLLLERFGHALGERIRVNPIFSQLAMDVLDCWIPRLLSVPHGGIPVAIGPPLFLGSYSQAQVDLLFDLLVSAHVGVRQSEDISEGDRRRVLDFLEPEILHLQARAKPSRSFVIPSRHGGPQWTGVKASKKIG